MSELKVNKLTGITGTSATAPITLSGDTVSFYGVVSPSPSYIAATGPDSAAGVIDGDYKVHVFTSSKSASNGFVVSAVGNANGSNTVEYLVVGAGGGGGGDTGGGGGAGAYRTATGMPVIVGNHAITIEGGGAGGTGNDNDTTVGSNGGDTILNTSPPTAALLANGGGGGGAESGARRQGLTNGNSSGGGSGPYPVPGIDGGVGGVVICCCGIPNDCSTCC